MNFSSTEVICSRDTSLSSAMAIPNFWTSRASSCLSTLAASCSPKLMRRMAARCVPASSSGLLAIRRNPILHDLRRPPRILADQRSRRRNLLLKAGGEFDRLDVLPRETHAIGPDVAAVATGDEFWPRLGQRFHERPQYQEGDHQHERGADDLLGQLRYPGRLPQRQSVDRRDRRHALEGLIQHIQLI